MPGAQGDAVLEFRAGTPVHCGGASEASEEEEEEEEEEGLFKADAVN